MSVAELLAKCDGETQGTVAPVLGRHVCAYCETYVPTVDGVVQPHDKFYDEGHDRWHLAGPLTCPGSLGVVDVWTGRMAAEVAALRLPMHLRPRSNFHGGDKCVRPGCDESKEPSLGYRYCEKCRAMFRAYRSRRPGIRKRTDCRNPGVGKGAPGLPRPNRRNAYPANRKRGGGYHR